MDKVLIEFLVWELNFRPSDAQELLKAEAGTEKTVKLTVKQIQALAAKAFSAGQSHRSTDNGEK